MQLDYKADDVEDIREYVHGGHLCSQDEVGGSQGVQIKIRGGDVPRNKKEEGAHQQRGWEREWAASHVGMPIEEFHHAGPNGLHRCLVMPLLGPSLKSLDVQDRPTLKKYLYQTALALQYLHRYNVAHGAVEPRNIRFQLDLGDANIYMTVQMKVFLGLEARRRRTRAKASDSVPSELICPADLRKLSPKGKIVLFLPKHAEFADDVPRWYQAPEVLTGLKKGPGGDAWSFCCTVLDIYAKCSLGLADISSETQLMEHVKILERFLGPLRPPSGHEVDDDGNVVRLIPPRRMCETEEEYEKWKRYACVPPWNSSPMKALLGSDWFRKHFAPKPVQPEGALPELEAGELGALLESALCYDEPKRSIELVLESAWLSSLYPGRRKPMRLGKTVDIEEESPYKYAKEDAEVGEQVNDTLSEAEPSVASQDEQPSKPKKVVNPLLKIPLDKELNLDTLLRLTHDVKVSVEKEYILGREDLGHRSSPEWKVEDAKNELEGTRNRPLTRRNPLEHYILNVCRAYRDHCDWATVRVKLLSLRARDADLYDNDTYWCNLTMKQIKKVLEEHAQYREARLEFYRQEIRNTSSVKLRMDMVLEFPDVQGGELSLYELLRLKSAAESDDEREIRKRLGGLTQTTQNTEEGRQGGLASIPEDTTRSNEIADSSLPDTYADDEMDTADDNGPEMETTRETGPNSRNTQTESDMSQEDNDIENLAGELQAGSQPPLPGSAGTSPTNQSPDTGIFLMKMGRNNIEGGRSG
ncbi:hypothetical protein PG990_013357 [Apiospora arundinis]